MPATPAHHGAPGSPDRRSDRVEDRIPDRVVERLQARDRRDQENRIREAQDLNGTWGIRSSSEGGRDGIIVPGDPNQQIFSVTPSGLQGDEEEDIRDPDAENDERPIMEMEEIYEAGSLDLRKVKVGDLKREERALLARLARQQAAAVATRKPGRKRKAPESDGPPPLSLQKVMKRPTRTQVITQAHALLIAFQEVVEFQSYPGDNRPAPALWSAEQGYLAVVQELLDCLKTLIEMLDSPVSKKAEKSQLAKTFERGTKRFVDSYSTHLGRGAAALTTAGLAALLYHLGIGQDIIADIIARFRAK